MRARTRLLTLALGTRLAAPAIATEKTGVFLWYGARVANAMEERAAILFPVEIGGVRCIMQLDTAAASSVLYRPLLSEETARRLESAELRLAGSSGRQLAPPARSLARQDRFRIGQWNTL